MSLRAFFHAVIVGVSLFSSLAMANELKGIRVWPAPEETRVVLDLKDEAVFSYFTLTKPDRLVVDLKQTTLKTKLPLVVKDSAILTKIRNSGAPEKGTYRLVLEMKAGMTPKLFKLAPTPDGTYSHRLVMDLPHGKVATAKKPESTPQQPVANQHASLPYGTDDIIVAIDPGHGGEDPGSIGPSRLYEKKVTLEISQKVAARINATPGMKAVMTRQGDYFVNLNRRTEIARRKRAHLLVSIHADGFHQPQPRGASVWVLNTRRANSEIGRWIEQHEKQSELLGGGDVLSGGNDDQYLSMAVLDLQFSHSQKEGYDVASRVLKEMSKVTTLHKSKPEHASLAVLKSPDIPSLLVETGFITNPTEERLLNSKSHQNKLADAVYRGVLSYFNEKPPEGTLFASRNQGIRHKVTSGQSLSVIASRYDTSVAAIKQANNLKSNTLKVGQVLVIPGKAPATAPATTAVAAATQTVTHTVKRGDFLGKIANQYGVTVASIRRDNNLRSDELAIGQKLKISAKAPVTTTAATTTKTVTHTVKRGEFLGKIAGQYGVTVASIRSANQLRSDELAVGQKLKITVKAPASVTHTVQRGEFLGKIAENYGVTVSRLREANQLRSDKLAVGQKLTIPSS
ncbi:LysM peptidoglycan-binding domain-containing protein [Photobacterium sp. DA100]|uniref:LysM peptidoglycan-binding domain-containing protein n=1 Tax=Photobacterium sp. DA100 TaxID=3027472 RepID=UPI0024797C0B|nr:LysM peptidoglycan-binding domain-containing protein [Photobacterium sp. DA100]WEM42096.1 LysM peptidoglycan-binding domain-containing protein [Photobacterium sp. DA100]